MRTLTSATLLACLYATAPAETSWTRQFLTDVGTLHSVTWNPTSGQLVAVGEGPAGSPTVFEGRIFTSPDGATWTSQGVQSANLTSVAWGEGQYVAIGKKGLIETSPNGITWTTRASGTTVWLRQVAWVSGLGDCGLWVAVGDGGTVLTSPDAETWTSQSSGTTLHLFDLAWIPDATSGKLVAVGSSGVILTSTDGDTWTPRASGSGMLLSGITYANGKAVVVGAQGALLTSPNGVTWTSQEVFGRNILLNEVAWGSPSEGGLGFLTATHVGYPNKSVDGTTWETFDPNGTAESYTDVIWAGYRYVLVGLNGRVLVSSKDCVPAEQDFSASEDGAGVTGILANKGTGFRSEVLRTAGKKTLRLELSRQERVSVQISDMRGARPHQLLNADLSAGSHEIALPQLGRGIFLLDSRVGRDRKTVKFLSE